ncbi:uncharacterized protein LOC113002761 [Solenopsis invicta]|uniref:uncharacterized protein LOC113002761 n=1 Tax=Solenopsis invicta TaxID=13686 RepID=UPI00193E3B79|nr:uncharacterized protein LOC113002761 [Solenopsis invicta]
MSSKRAIYSDLEKQIFLEILKKYKHVIEAKGTNSSTLKEKSEAWLLIMTEYNDSSLISTKRDVQQLRKYWSNLKQQSKNILTTERQSRFLTGGESQQNIDEVDPNVLDIVPDLMTTAPTISSSNFSTKESTDRQREVLKAIKQNSLTRIDHISNREHWEKQKKGLSSNTSSNQSISDNISENVSDTMIIDFEMDDAVPIEETFSNDCDTYIENENTDLLEDIKKNKRANVNKSCLNLKKQKNGKNDISL